MGVELLELHDLKVLFRYLVSILLLFFWSAAGGFSFFFFFGQYGLLLSIQLLQVSLRLV
jgi:hypothetical protein